MEDAPKENVPDDLRAARRALEMGLLGETDFETVVQELKKGPSQLLATVLREVKANSKGEDTSDTTVPARSLPPRIGKYEIQSELGRGGMGVVYKAFDPSLGRTVAVKCLLDSAEPEMVKRFEREARTVARLSHPNIVPIYEVGVEGDRRFIAMEFVEGTPLDRVKLDYHRAAEAMIDVSRAVHFAHLHGIIHRDLKPQNLMLSKDGHVWVMDFGIAHQRGGKGTLTATGDVMGTPSFMSPEQASGRSHEVDARSDVWSLGATLYALTTDRAPFRGDTLHAILFDILSTDPVRPRAVRGDVPVDLETITLKCLEKDPARRYLSAGELADDLRRWLDGDSIKARPASVAYRIRKSLAKRKAVVAALGLGFVALVVALVFLLPRLSETERKLSETEQQRQAGRAKLSDAEAELQLWSRIATVQAEAERLARVGETKRGAKRLEEGISICREVLARHEFAAGRFFLGRLLYQRGSGDEALAELDRALEMDPQLGEASVCRGILLARQYEDRLGGLERGFVAAIPVRDGRELEELDPVLKDLRSRIEKDLSVSVGRSAYFTEVEKAYHRGEFHRIRGEWDKATKLYRRMLSLDPAQTGARLALAWIARMERRLDEALQELDKAIDHDRGSWTAYYVRSGVYHDRVEADPYHAESATWRTRSLEDIERALKLKDESDPVLLNNRAILRLEMGNVGGAREDLQRARGRSPNLALAHGNFGNVAKRLGDSSAARGDRREAIAHWKEAVESFDKALSLEPGLIGAYLNRADLRRSFGDFAGATEDAQRAMAIPSLAPDVHFVLGKIFQDQGEFTRAIEQFRKALAKRNRFPHALVECAAALHRRGASQVPPQTAWDDWEQALRDCAEALSIRPRFPEAFGVRGNVLRARGDLLQGSKPAEALLELDSALKDYGSSLELDPNLVDSYNNRGATYHTRGFVLQKLGRGEDALASWDAAIEDYGRALAKAPEHRGALENRIRAAYLRGKRGRKEDFKTALEDATRLIGLEPNLESGYLLRSVVRKDTGDSKGALEDLGEAVRINPKNAAAFHTRGGLRYGTGDLKGAIEEYTKALEADGQYHFSLENRGICYMKLRRFPEAIADFEKALAIGPKEWEDRTRIQGWIEMLKKASR